MLCWVGFCERAWRGVFRLADANLTGMPEVTWQDTFYEPVRCHCWAAKDGADEEVS